MGLREEGMIKFWKEDFKYIRRSPYTHYFVEGFGYSYTFSVRGESANYLINKYDLDYPNIQVHLFTGDNSMTVTSRTDNKLNSDVDDINEDDIEELLAILQPIVDSDLRNYEEYMCNDDLHRDSRWN